MTDEMWRPLGVETDEEIAEYDALHDGVPEWMSTTFWEWVRASISEPHVQRYAYSAEKFWMPRTELLERMAHSLRISMPSVKWNEPDKYTGGQLVSRAMATLEAHHFPLQIADFLLAFGNPNRDVLQQMLERSNSAWSIGEREGRRGLVRRVPEGVQIAADATMASSGSAGVRLAQAWEALYGVTPNESEAYRLAVKAVEAAAIPRVCPQDSKATLGKVINVIDSQSGWSVETGRADSSATPVDVLLGMMRMLWAGQHDRHDGSPATQTPMTFDHAAVAVHLASTLVAWFAGGYVTRNTTNVKGSA